MAAGVTLFAVRLSAVPPDAKHPYGHGKVENLSALAETALLLLTCVWIIYEAVDRLFFNPREVDASLWAVGVMVVSIVVDFSRSRMLLAVAKKHNSQALEADALHFSTDIWSSAVVLLGLLGVLLAWRLTGRLKRLAAEAGELGEGRFGVKTDARGSDEVADLAAAFNRMSDRLLELETLKKNFTASVTHELRSPLGVIETYAAMLLKEKEKFSAEDLEVFGRIKENAGRLANFVTAMLDLAKIERGKMELRPSYEDPAALAADAADFLRPKAAEKGVELTLEAAAGPPCLLDRELITHALTNLVSNAIKFSKSGGKVQVTVSVSDKRCRMEVRDSGPGLKPGEEKKLFEPYAQGSAAPGHGGTGLGLALSKSIVELHKGSIGCAPAPGGGALFWFDLPV